MISAGAERDLWRPLTFKRQGPLEIREYSNNFNAVFIILRKCLIMYQELVSFKEREIKLRQKKIHLLVCGAPFPVKM